MACNFSKKEVAERYNTMLTLNRLLDMAERGEELPINQGDYLFTGNLDDYFGYVFQIREHAVRNVLFYFLREAACFLSLCLFQMTQSGPEMKREEMPPEIIPNAIGTANVRKVERPKSSETTTIVITAINVVIEVMMFLIITLFMLVLTSSPISISGLSRSFSRIRS